MVAIQTETLVQKVKGSLEGETEAFLQGVGSLKSAKKGEVSFFSQKIPNQDFRQSKASVILVRKDFFLEEKAATAILRVENPRLAFAEIMHLFSPKKEVTPGISPHAWVDPLAEVHPTACIMSGVYVGPKTKIGAGCLLYPGVVVLEEVMVGADCVFYPGAVVREGTKIGDRVCLQPNANVGGDGFGYERFLGGVLKVPQIGQVVLEEDTELGSGACVDRATLDQTFVGKGSKLDNLVSLGHNTNLGERCLVAAQCGFSGGVKLGEECNLAGQVGLVPQVEVGARSTMYGKTMVSKNHPKDSHISGIPSQAHRKEVKEKILLRKLETALKRISKLENQVALLEKSNSPD